jgi:hypothetical protein
MAEKNKQHIITKKIDRSLLDKDLAGKIVFDHDFQKENISRALEIVKNFILTRQRIIVGGQGIEFALRAKGSYLYSESTIPDYDIISCDFHKDAYTIANMLSEHFDRVDVINALHVSTMRVRINFVVTADVSYIPKNIYDKIPFIMYEGLKVVHPNFQCIDQHVALSLPFENPPRETIISAKRWTNDITRYELLTQYYPFDEKIMDQVELGSQGEQEITKIPYEEWDSICVGGYLGLVFWLTKAKELGRVFDFSDLGAIIFGKHDITFKMPTKTPITILTDDFEAFLKYLQGVHGGRSKKKKRVGKGESAGMKPIYFNSLMGKIPRYVQYGRYQIIDNKGFMTGCNQPLTTKRLYFANLQNIMVYLLSHAIFYQEQHAMRCYLIAKDLLYWACSKYNGLGLSTTEEAAQSAKEKYAAFLPTQMAYGNYNWAESYILSRENILRQLGDTRFNSNDKKPREAHLRIHEQVPPKQYDYIPENSPLYQIDGQQCEIFVARELPMLSVPLRD